MTEQNYSQLSAEIRQIKRKAPSANVAAFLNKVRTLDARARNLIKAFGEQQLNQSHIAELNEAILAGVEFEKAQDFGLNEADIKRLEHLVSVQVRTDYTELEGLREKQAPEAVLRLEYENQVLMEEKKDLQEEIRKMEQKQRILDAAFSLSPEHVKAARDIIAKL